MGYHGQLEYEDAKNEQAFVEGRIITWRNCLPGAYLEKTEKENTFVV